LHRKAELDATDGGPECDAFAEQSERELGLVLAGVQDDELRPPVEALEVPGEVGQVGSDGTATGAAQGADPARGQTRLAEKLIIILPEKPEQGPVALDAKIVETVQIAAGMEPPDEQHRPPGRESEAREQEKQQERDMAGWRKHC
jgi:hypothetical protein